MAGARRAEVRDLVGEGADDRLHALERRLVAADQRSEDPVRRALRAAGDSAVEVAHGVLLPELRSEGRRVLGLAGRRVDPDGARLERRADEVDGGEGGVRVGQAGDDNLRRRHGRVELLGPGQGDGAVLGGMALGRRAAHVESRRRELGGDPPGQRRAHVAQPDGDAAPRRRRRRQLPPLQHRRRRAARRALLHQETGQHCGASRLATTRAPLRWNPLTSLSLGTRSVALAPLDANCKSRGNVMTELALLDTTVLIFRDKVRLSVGRLAAACQSRRRTARPRWCNALSPHAVHQAGPAASRVAFQVQ